MDDIVYTFRSDNQVPGNIWTHCPNCHRIYTFRPDNQVPGNKWTTSSTLLDLTIRCLGIYGHTVQIVTASTLLDLTIRFLGIYGHTVQIVTTSTLLDLTKTCASFPTRHYTQSQCSNCHSV
uniref:Uncharacterized protein n=1 Tax=Metapenaeus joyneri majanivirus TaxID=2984280 RepID=A0A9C7BN83_9VIRU|nr:MAG: hypothetical protein [Metapenaeus joyneri majanivirus]